MIVKDATRTVPSEWTNAAILELFDHARELGRNGNPAGYLLTVAWEPWVGYIKKPMKYPLMKDYHAWDYDGIRQWIAANQEHVADVWQLVARSL